MILKFTRINCAFREIVVPDIIACFLLWLHWYRTFHYDSSLWNNKEAFNLDGGKTGFDTRETKLPSYWNTSFSKICLGMKIGQQIKFIVINRTASSLYSLIADGQYRNTSLGRDTWKSLIGSNASLEIKCNKEGFNTLCDWKKRSKARIGIVGNKGNNCNSCYSRIGFGTGGKPDDSITCGNQASSNGDNGAKNIKAMGYIMVQWEETDNDYKFKLCCVVSSLTLS